MKGSRFSGERQSLTLGRTILWAVALAAVHSIHPSVWLRPASPPPMPGIVVLEPLHPLWLGGEYGHFRLRLRVTLPADGVLSLRSFVTFRAVEDKNTQPTALPWTGTALLLSARPSAAHMFVAYSPVRPQIRTLALPPFSAGSTHTVVIETDDSYHAIEIDGQRVVTASVPVGPRGGIVWSASDPNTTIEVLASEGIAGEVKGAGALRLADTLRMLVYFLAIVLAVAAIQGAHRMGGPVAGARWLVGLMFLNVLIAPMAAIPLFAVGVPMGIVVVLTARAVLRQRIGTRRWPLRWAVYLTFAALVVELLARATPGLRTAENLHWKALSGESFLRWELDPYMWSTEGGRDADFRDRGAPLCDGKRRDWAVYGGSVAYGRGFASDERVDFPAQIEDRERARGIPEPIRVHNAAWPRATVHYMHTRDEALKLSACVRGAIVATLVNDAALGSADMAEYESMPTPLPSLWFSRDIEGFMRFYLTAWHLFPGGFGRRDAEQLARYRAALKRFLAHLRANGVERIVLLDETHQSLLEPDIPDRFQTFVVHAEVMREVAREEGLPVVDAREIFAGQVPGDLFFDRLHLTRLGHRLVAEALDPYILADTAPTFPAATPP